MGKARTKAMSIRRFFRHLFQASCYTEAELRQDLYRSIREFQNNVDSGNFQRINPDKKVGFFFPIAARKYITVFADPTGEAKELVVMLSNGQHNPREFEGDVICYGTDLLYLADTTAKWLRKNDHTIDGLWHGAE